MTHEIKRTAVLAHPLIYKKKKKKKKNRSIEQGILQTNLCSKIGTMLGGYDFLIG
jgi:hypothetical protein